MLFYNCTLSLPFIFGLVVFLDEVNYSYNFSMLYDPGFRVKLSSLFFPLYFSFFLIFSFRYISYSQLELVPFSTSLFFIAPQSIVHLQLL